MGVPLVVYVGGMGIMRMLTDNTFFLALVVVMHQRMQGTQGPTGHEHPKNYQSV
jgi:hypothetical protein